MATPFLRPAPLAVAVLIAAGAAAPAVAQQMQGYNFPARQAANLAVIMKQIDEGAFAGGGSAAASSSGPIQQYICSGPSGDSSSTGNFGCIIVGENANADVGTDQDAAGDQTATNTTSGTVNTQTTTAEQVNAILNGEAAGLQ